MKKALFIVFAVTLFVLLNALPAFAITTPLILVADDNNATYLGDVTSNTYDVNGIFNQYGLYGSKTGLDSIWNSYGLYGSQCSIWSPFDQYSIMAPFIIDGNGNVIGRLTVNNYVTGAVNPYFLYATLQSLGI